jgi:hypothetical protein
LGDKYWVALAVDNSIPRPEPDPETGLPPMYFNASPLIVPTDEGDDALCVFTTKGKAIAYLKRSGARRLGVVCHADAHVRARGLLGVLG